jgi:hypothetical protein
VRSLKVFNTAENRKKLVKKIIEDWDIRMMLSYAIEKVAEEYEDDPNNFEIVYNLEFGFNDSDGLHSEENRDRLARRVVHSWNLEQLHFNVFVFYEDYYENNPDQFLIDYREEFPLITLELDDDLLGSLKRLLKFADSCVMVGMHEGNNIFLEDVENIKRLLEEKA